MGHSFSKQTPGDQDEVDLNRFSLRKCVGRGAFGKVRIVQHKESRIQYALKYIDKQQCIRQRAVGNILRERDMLIRARNPYVVNLRYSFQDDTSLFMVLDLMLGGSLLFQLDLHGGFEEAAVRHIAAELFLALDYLHSIGIVHRDIKPDNLLLDLDGHVHLTDFNVAADFRHRCVMVSHSGTASYMAPEIWTGKGYTWTCDLWSLGMILYEFTYGRLPFRRRKRSDLMHDVFYAPIVYHERNLIKRWPVNVQSDGIALIQSLLERDFTKRFGCSAPYLKAVKQHPWFKDMDWEGLQHKRIPGVFKPDRNKVNFDGTFDLEDQLFADKPLAYKPRKNKPKPASALSPAAADAAKQAGGASPNSSSATSRPDRPRTAPELKQQQQQQLRAASSMAGILQSTMTLNLRPEATTANEATTTTTPAANAAKVDGAHAAESGAVAPSASASNAAVPASATASTPPPVPPKSGVLSDPAVIAAKARAEQLLAAESDKRRPAKKLTPEMVEADMARMETDFLTYDFSKLMAPQEMETYLASVQVMSKPHLGRRKGPIYRPLVRTGSLSAQAQASGASPSESHPPRSAPLSNSQAVDDSTPGPSSATAHAQPSPLEFACVSPTIPEEPASERLSEARSPTPPNAAAAASAAAAAVAASSSPPPLPDYRTANLKFLLAHYARNNYTTTVDPLPLATQSQLPRPPTTPGPTGVAAAAAALAGSVVDLSGQVRLRKPPPVPMGAASAVALPTPALQASGAVPGADASASALKQASDVEAK